MHTWSTDTAASLPTLYKRTLSPSASQSVAGPAKEEDSWATLFKLPADESAGLIMLMDAHTYDERFLAYLDRALPDGVKVGGLTAGGVYFDGEWLDGGGAGVVLSGTVAVDCIVAQGAEEFGPEMIVDSSEANFVVTVDEGQTALNAVTPHIREEQERHPEDFRPDQPDRILVGLKVDAKIKSGQTPDDVFKRGFTQYTCRQIMQMDPQSGALGLAVSPEVLKSGQKLRLHRFSRGAAEAEMSRQCKAYLDHNAGRAPAGALVFSCAGRGVGLYGEEGVETALMAEVWGSQVAASSCGFFAAGEVGPVGFRTHTHSFTTSMALLRHRITR